MAIKESILANGGAAHVVPSNLNYYLDPAKGGVKEFWPGTAGGYRRKHEPHAVEVTDVSGHEKEFDLDKQGFAYVQHESKEKEFADEEGLKERFYPEVAELVKEVTGATYVKPYSHLVRRERWEELQTALEGKTDDELLRKKVPARFAHIDHSYTGAVQILNDNFKDEQERDKLSKTRWAIINVWRPIHHTATRDPLAVCDARSVEETDLEGTMAHLPPKDSKTYENVSLGENFELWSIRANPAHRWYYKSHMTPDEALLLKIFDSKKDGRARRVPHTSFQSEEDYGEPRNSIEIRCFVFWEDQSVE